MVLVVNYNNPCLDHIRMSKWWIIFLGWSICSLLSVQTLHRSGSAVQHIHAPMSSRTSASAAAFCRLCSFSFSAYCLFSRVIIQVHVWKNSCPLKLLVNASKIPAGRHTLAPGRKTALTLAPLCDSHTQDSDI